MTSEHLQPQSSPSGDPSPAAVIPPALLADLINPSLSLTDVASRNNLSPSDLSLYISRAAVSNHLASMHILAIERSRLVASFHLTQAISGLSYVLKRATADHDASEVAPQPAPASESPSPRPAAIAVRAAAIRARRLETLRRAATTILQITRLNPPVFNYAGTHAQLEGKLPPEPAQAPVQSAPPASPPAPAKHASPQLSEADLKALFSGQPALGHNRSRHARNLDLKSMLTTAGSTRPHEHWP
jgi:hypothetical protein